MESLERNRNTIIRFFATQSSGIDFDFENDCISEDIQFILPFTILKGRESIRNLFQAERDIWQGLNYAILRENVIVESNKGAAFWNMSGKQIGVFHNVPPTQTDINIGGCSLFKFNEEGKITEIKIQIDLMNLMLQIKGIEVLYP